MPRVTNPVIIEVTSEGDHSSAVEHFVISKERCEGQNFFRTRFARQSPTNPLGFDNSSTIEGSIPLTPDGGLYKKEVVGKTVRRFFRIL